MSLLKARAFQPTTVTDTIVVVPDHLTGDTSVRRLADACESPVLGQHDFDVADFAETHVIACGHLANNAAITRLYNARCCFVDTLFPGNDDYLVRSIRDPVGAGYNAIVTGASSDKGLRDAVAELTKCVEASDGVLNRVHIQQLASGPKQPVASEVDDLIAKDLATWHGGWVASPFRGGKLKSYLWHQYLDDGDVWGHLIKGIFAGSVDQWREQRGRDPHDYHDFFHLDQFIRLWDLVEDHPLYTEQDRQAVVEMFIELLRHLAGLFYLQEEVNPDDMPRQNHTTFVGLNLAVGHQYLSRRYGVTEFADVSARVERIFAGQALGYKPNDDAGVGYVWHTPHHTLDYWLLSDDHRYLDEGHVADLCRLLAITTDNLRSEVGYGDSSGYAAFDNAGWRDHLWPLLASLWRTQDPAHLWLLNWLAEGKAPSLHQAIDTWRSSVNRSEDGFTLPGVEPMLPRDLLGVAALDLPDSARNFVAANVPVAHQPTAGSRYFDKLSIRPGFTEDDEYLLLEGVGTMCHGHEDTNAILGLSWKNRAWLADGDYIRAAPKFHNSISIQRDGVGVFDSPGDGIVIPPLARLLEEHADEEGGVVQSEVAGYNGMDWRRNLVWRSGRYIVVVDELRCTEAGDFRCRCYWRVVGDVTEAVDRVGLQQDGVELFLHSGHTLEADESSMEIVDDGAAWGGYPHHSGNVHVVHQKLNRRLRQGESMFFLHVFTPHDDLRVERCADGQLRICDEGETRLVGIDEIGAIVNGAGKAVADQIEHHPEGEAPDDGMILSRPTLSVTRRSVETQPIADLIWRQRIVESVAALVLFDDEDEYRMVVADTKGDLVCVSTDDGSELWRVQLPSAASVLLTADIDGDGAPEVIAGLASAEVVVIDAAGGAERWRRPLKNLYDSAAAVTVLRVADLEGDGDLSVLVGTAGWFVNVFKPDGTPKWTQWFRYHVITAVEAADVDNDGRAEVIVGNTYSTPLTVHEFDGTFRWSTLEQVGAEGNATTPRRGIGLTQMRLCDVDGDGRQEIIYGTEDGWIFAVDSLAGDEVWQLNIVGKVVALEVTEAGVLAASEHGDLYLLSLTGEILSMRHVSEWIRSATRCGDEIVMATEEGQLLWLGAAGDVLGSAHVDGEIRHLLARDQDVICVTEDDTISAFLSL
ncbi:MAG: PQQ-binding-like beta-propeller repeat protein [Gemmatimonadetes bacterium]|jgi:outer membrane protein assembly factor BamB|nr:PQQ-binding-like beta-propeller repeat protein [Gemmatimonadota bacterium]MBT5141281.1 PQQ-binding-like beta-propeller repeat protein [Gemmatimonadota bacterium]MBT5590362.1 PQQ-binding-like beta-propeller repeat protein [Gemmatimonadota bacterium]MBT5963895.1 PQQ-binding-like beta-propeller repeat protein [Gemmatimonadota bacterium]MBT7597578.1 PQQ-binding-like beta-propeller repeat protein [Gemmatimonadota bacterium]